MAQGSLLKTLVGVAFVASIGVGGYAWLIAPLFDGKRSEQSTSSEHKSDGTATGDGALRISSSSDGSADGSLLIRVYKQSGELELWQRTGERYEFRRSVSLCNALKLLGPKRRLHDGVTPEGFYHMPASLLEWSFERDDNALPIGFPNTFDLGFGNVGEAVQLSGGCGSGALFALAADDMKQLVQDVRAALKGGQKVLPIHIYPFRMSWGKLEFKKGQPIHGFWLNLKEAYDYFQASHKLPRFGVCGRRYWIAAEGSKESERLDSDERCLPLKPGSEVQFETAKKHSWLRRALEQQGIAYWQSKRAVEKIEVKCNLKLPPCRRWYNLRLKMIENGHVPPELTGDL